MNSEANINARKFNFLGLYFAENYPNLIFVAAEFENDMIAKNNKKCASNIFVFVLRMENEIYAFEICFCLDENEKRHTQSEYNDVMIL